MKSLATALLIALVLIPFAGVAHGYSQDPRSCADPKLPFPSLPPCHR